MALEKKKAHVHFKKNNSTGLANKLEFNVYHDEFFFLTDLTDSIFLSNDD